MKLKAFILSEGKLKEIELVGKETRIQIPLKPKTKYAPKEPKY